MSALWKPSAAFPLLVPDNPKVAIVKACFYDPQVHRTYSAFAEHYDIGILPARPRKPRDKAKVESCVLIVEHYLLGRLRHRTFYSLAELNQAIEEMLADINGRRPLRRLGVTRQQLFEELDLPALKPLPAEPYVYAEWRVRRAGLDYHVEVEDHYTAFPSASPKTSSKSASRRARWKCSTRASASRPICATRAVVVTRPPLSTCRPATGTSPIGPSSVSAARPRP